MRTQQDRETGRCRTPHRAGAASRSDRRTGPAGRVRSAAPGNPHRRLGTIDRHPGCPSCSRSQRPSLAQWSSCLSRSGFGSEISGEPDAGEGTSVVRVEEVAVARAQVVQRRGAAAPAQHHLVAHELAVVFTGRAFERLETGVRQVGRAGPGPQIPVPLAVRTAGIGCRKLWSKVLPCSGCCASTTSSSRLFSAMQPIR